MATNKKIVHVEGGSDSSAPSSTETKFTPTSESKGKATQLRVIAGILWFFAIAAQVVAIRMLFKPPVSMMWMIILIAVDLILAVIGSVLWKKSNRLDPASEQNKFMFFMQSQLGLVVAVIAFLPLIIFILTSKNVDKKQKGILGAIAGAALLIAGVSGIDFNPPSVEQFTEQTSQVESLTGGKNFVYWAKSSKVYHLYNDCSYINGVKTSEINEGTVAQAREMKHITELCSRCEARAKKEQGTENTNVTTGVTGAIESALETDSVH